MFETVLSRWKRLDCLVNNAGFQRESPSEALDIDTYRRIIDVNLNGAVLCAQKALAHFVARGGGGSIINCSSVHQIIPKPGYLAYSISKGGIANLTRTLALEFAGRGIRVNAVGPGAIDTPINAAWTGDPAKRGVVTSHIPLGRVGTPEEIAAVFAFLASDEASYITGQTIYACGGSTLFPSSARTGRARNVDLRPKPRTHHPVPTASKISREQVVGAPAAADILFWPQRHISSRGWNRTQSEFRIAEWVLGLIRFNASSSMKNEASMALSCPQNRTACRVRSYERL